MDEPRQCSARGRALVTGASSGLGAAFASRLARDGHDVILLGRRAERLEALAAELRGKHGVAAEFLIADLSIDDELAKVENRIRAEPELQVLVNNAGFTHLRPFNELSDKEITDMILVHVVAVTRLTHAALPGMLARGRGDVINVASDGIFVPFPAPIMVVYAATKSYIATFTRGLHRLAGERGVRVQALCTGYVRSEILDRHGLSFEDWSIEDSVVMSADDQVICSLAGLEMGEVMCVPTLDDPSLIEKIRELESTVRDRSSSTGVPAARYMHHP
jgi:uncharacterized protein